MARARTTLDSFNAIAEPKRREVLMVLAAGECGVGDLVATLKWPQPQVSKHLGVLREAGIVSVRSEGRRRMYSVNGDSLKTVHDWAAQFERFWSHQLDRIKTRAEAAARRRAGTDGPDSQGDHRKEK